MQQSYAVINAFGRTNRGDAVLLDQCIADIQAAAPLASIAVVVFEGIADAKNLYPQLNWSERIGTTRRRLKIFRRAESICQLTIAFLSVAAGLPALLKFLPAEQRAAVHDIQSASTVIVAPGGQIHDTNNAYLISLFHIWVALKTGARVVFAPQSIGPVRNRVGRLLLRSILEKSALICVRENFTENFLVELGIPSSTLIKTGDSAFWNQLPCSVVEDASDFDAAKLASAKKKCGMTVVDWNFPHHLNPEERRENYVRQMARVAERVSSELDMDVVIFNQVSSDLRVANAISLRSKVPITIDTAERSPDDLRQLLSRVDVFLGTRLHSCIFAMMEGVPTTAIAYLPKTNFIMNDLGLSDHVFEITSLEADSVFNVIHQDAVNRRAASARIINSINQYRADKLNFANVLIELNNS